MKCLTRQNCIGIIRVRTGRNLHHELLISGRSIINRQICSGWQVNPYFIVARRINAVADILSGSLCSGCRFGFHLLGSCTGWLGWRCDRRCCHCSGCVMVDQTFCFLSSAGNSESDSRQQQNGWNKCKGNAFSFCVRLWRFAKRIFWFRMVPHGLIAPCSFACPLCALFACPLLFTGEI